MGAKPQLCYNRIRVVNNRVIMRLQFMLFKTPSGGTCYSQILVKNIIMASCCMLYPETCPSLWPSGVGAR